MHIVGEVLQGRYRIEALLGQGGMGGVYLATHQGLNIKVAIKEMTVALDDPGMVAQFRREAQRLHELRHENLPQVHDFFAYGGSHYLVMDYVQGGTLEDRIRFEPASAADMLRWAEGLCRVLDYLHHHSPPIIFRDLKPSNIMLGDDGVIKLIDFGIAKDFDVATGLGTRTTVRGAGTPGFAPPEQYGTGTDVRTDIYALGATLYCLLTRVAPPDSTDRASGQATLRPLGELRPDLNPHIIDTIERMMALNRNDRPMNAVEVANALGVAVGWASTSISPVRPNVAVPAGGAAAARGETVLSPMARGLETPPPPPSFSAPPTAPTPPTSPPPTPRSRTLPWLLLALGGAAVLGGCFGLAWHYTHLSITIDSDPPHASVIVDNAPSPYPTTPLRLDGLWWNGTMNLQIHQDGYQDQVANVKVSSGDQHFTLVPESHTLTVSTNIGSGTLAIDGQSAGPINRDGGHFEVKAGPHTLTLTPAAGFRGHPQVAVTVPTVGDPAPATLHLDAVPPKKPPHAVVRHARPAAIVHHEAVSPPTVPIALHLHAIVAGQQLGDIHLGEAATPVVARLHLKSGRVFRIGQAFNTPGLVAFVKDDRIDSVRIFLTKARTPADVQTASGLRLGSSTSDLLQKLGQPKKITKNPENHWDNWVYRGIIFNVEGNKVTGLRVFRLEHHTRMGTRAKR